MSNDARSAPGTAISPIFLSSAAPADPATVNAATAVASRNLTRMVSSLPYLKAQRVPRAGYCIFRAAVQAESANRPPTGLPRCSKPVTPTTGLDVERTWTCGTRVLTAHHDVQL